MRVVLDTNVVVSALLNPEGPPAAVLAVIFTGEVIPLLDSRLLAEYREVLLRPRFGFTPEQVEAVVSGLLEIGELVDAPPLGLRLPDPDDVPFLEVAVAGQADAIVTGNVRHFPSGSCPARTLSPSAFLAWIGATP